MTLEKMIQLHKDLTPVEITIANYILKNQDKVMDMTIQELASSIFISKSAIHRFCKKIGLKGFNELKVQISKNETKALSNALQVDVNYPFFSTDGPIEIAYKLMELFEITVKETFECIDKGTLQSVAEMLEKAEMIDIYTHAHNLNIADNFQDKMLSIGRSVNCPKSFYNQRLSVLASDESHVALVLSYSGKASWILPIVKKLYEKGIPIIMISKIGAHVYPQYITKHLAISDNEKLQDRISQFSSHISLQYIMDVLYGCIYNRNRKENIEYFYDSIDYMDDRQIEGIKK